MKKTTFVSIFVLLLFFEQFIELPPDTAVLYPGMNEEEIEARTDSLIGAFYDHASTRVDSLFNRFISRRHPGAAVAVIKDGHFLHKNCYGLANLNTKEAITPDTQFLLASVSKQFTAMAVMMLAEEGKLSYDDSISEYFDNIPASWNKITIRHLLTHTSGLPDRFRLIGYAEGWLNEDILDRLIQHRRLEFTPGKRFRYSNSGYNLLAIIVEKISGMPFRVFLKRRIFIPLDMKNTLVYDQTKPEFSKKAIAYRPLRRRGYYRPNDFLLYTTGASGVYSTIEDLYKWDQALYTERLVSRKTLDDAFAPHTKTYGGEYYGYGWHLTQGSGTDAVYHTGTLGGTSNIFFRVPEENFAIIILTNRSLKSRKWYVRKIAGYFQPGLIDETGF